ncbi:MAG: dihydropteroate synthase [Chloroflexi bacterium]|nr:dihydropteroate synthase [Chloroflexota bacterium]MYF81955.1 dihydropteroate synthase [Chloroflexota bacterium]MYI04611.1 dihydropteroate synthase [Chloroflexota bacterium]
MKLDDFAWGSRTLIVGILNVTPDSFAGDGLLDADAAVARGEQLASEGADIIDVGGQSTRPGFEAVSADEECRRVVPVLARLASRLPGTPLSVDTTKAAVAAAAFDAGATILNDINGLRGDSQLACLAAERDAWVIAMHNQRARPAATDPVETILAGFCTSLETGARHGVQRERILLDPGFGFGWRSDENAQILRRLTELRAPGRPLLVGMSRKRMTGEQFGWDVGARFEGSAAVTAIAIANGADLVRVHDVAAMSRVVRMADDIVRSVGR